MNRQPTTVRQTAPSPPWMLVPPTTMPASTVKVRNPPLDAWALSTREASRTPANAAAAPLSANVAIRIASTRTPPRRAASALPPVAYT